MRLLVICVAMLLIGCGDRRTFDERYNDTSAELDNKAQQLDRNLSEVPANAT